jgi:hypothetical protein
MKIGPDGVYQRADSFSRLHMLILIVNTVM